MTITIMKYILYNLQCIRHEDNNYNHNNMVFDVVYYDEQFQRKQE
jgi:hypothetical protein